MLEQQNLHLSSNQSELTSSTRTDLSHGVRHHQLGGGGTDRNMLLLVSLVRRVLVVASQVVVLGTEEAGRFEVKNGVLW